VRTIHLVGPGEVGRRLLERLPRERFRLVAVSDSTATVFDRAGLDPLAIAAHKQAGGSLGSLPRAEAIATELAVELVGADVVVDATPSGKDSTEGALRRGRAALRIGARLVLCGKNALAAAAGEWLGGELRGRVGINAVLGGTGLQLLRELGELRARCDELQLVGNVTTTVIVQAIERGAAVEQGIAHARALGLLEPDPTLDLDGSDAAVKLAAVHGAVFGSVPGAIAQQDVRQLDAKELQARARRGATTRLVARGSRHGGDLRVAFEELPRTSPLAAPPDRVVYGYRLGEELRVHTGLGVGYERTAEAALQDLLAAEVRR
jgi:homoserine dehydrogenase